MVTNNKVISGIPDIVVARLPVYLRTLTHIAQSGKANTSSQELGRRLGISSAQIRKDLAHFGEFGKQGTGYNVAFLIDQLLTILNLDTEWEIAIIGAGFLGHALAHYQGFQHRGFRIAWIFDVDEQKVGKRMDGLVVHHLDELREIAKREKVKLAILAVPIDAAQSIAEYIVECGINAILNYAPINLALPPEIHIQYSDPVVQMQHMTYYIGDEGHQTSG